MNSSSPSGIEAAVCHDIAERQRRGIAKYGMTVAENPLPLREWLQHAYEETLDKAIYLKRAIAEIDNNKAQATTGGSPHPFVRRKCAAIYAPIPGTDEKRWLCVAVDGNLQWKTVAECYSEDDAIQWAKRTRKHWRKFSDLQVCHRLMPNEKSAQPP